MLLGLGVRVWVLMHSDSFSADEAIEGIMALHIAEGHAAPVFFYGQHYFGALEAYLAAGLLKVTGVRDLVLNVPAMAASVALIPLTWATARRVGPPAAGVYAAALVAVPAPALTRLFVYAGGGFSLAFALHSAVLLALLQATVASRGATGWAAAFSLLAGLLCWVWQPGLVLYPVLLVYLLASREELREPRRLVVTIAGVLVGLAPLVISNLLGGWSTVADLVVKSSQPTDLSRVTALLLTALGGGTEEGDANPIEATLVAASVPVALLLLATARRARIASVESHWRGALVLVLVGLIDVVVAHSATRYFAPVALIGSVLFGAAVALVSDRVRVMRMGFGIAVVLTIVVPNLWHIVIRPQQEYGDDVPHASEVRAVLRDLQERGLRYGYSDYWSAYPVTYFAAEEVIVAPVLPVVFGGRLDRYPTYTHMVDAVQQPRELFVLVDGRCTPEPYTAALTRAGATFTLERVSRWHLIWNVAPSDPDADPAAILQTLRETAHTNQTC